MPSIRQKTRIYLSQYVVTEIYFLFCARLIHESYQLTFKDEGINFEVQKEYGLLQGQKEIGTSNNGLRNDHHGTCKHNCQDLPPPSLLHCKWRF